MTDLRDQAAALDADWPDDADDLLRRHKESLFPSVALFYDEPIELRRGERQYVYVERAHDRATKEPAPDVLGRVQNEAKRRGLIIGRGGLHANVIRICPPLIVSDRDVDDAIRILDEAFAAATMAP